MRTRPGHSGTDEQRGLDNLNFILDLVEVGGDQPKIDLTWRLRNCGHGARPPFQLLIQTGKTDRERKESVDFSLFPLPLCASKIMRKLRLPLPSTTTIGCMKRAWVVGGGPVAGGLPASLRRRGIERERELESYRVGRPICRKVLLCFSM